MAEKKQKEPKVLTPLQVETALMKVVKLACRTSDPEASEETREIALGYAPQLAELWSIDEAKIRETLTTTDEKDGLGFANKLRVTIEKQRQKRLEKAVPPDLAEATRIVVAAATWSADVSPMEKGSNGAAKVSLTLAIAAAGFLAAVSALPENSAIAFASDKIPGQIDDGQSIARFAVKPLKAIAKLKKPHVRVTFHPDAVAYLKITWRTAAGTYGYLRFLTQPPIRFYADRMYAIPLPALE